MSYFREQFYALAFKEGNRKIVLFVVPSDKFQFSTTRFSVFLNTFLESRSPELKVKKYSDFN